MRFEIEKGRTLDDAIGSTAQKAQPADESPFDLQRSKNDLVKEIRGKLGVSQSVFGQFFDVSQGTISRIERGKKEEIEFEDKLIEEVIQDKQWTGQFDYLLLEFKRMRDGHPTRRGIQKWMDKRSGDRIEYSTIGVEIDENLNIYFIAYP